jgi:hypothetical protein
VRFETGKARLPPPIADEELDELILSRLRSRGKQTERNELHDATQIPTDWRLRSTITGGGIVESAALPGRWMIAVAGDLGSS